ncbi:hypothetical protein B0O99DRAFT_696559 [Bisporella sp. PMI_857]|nr:hypothetical protein B0O99DRAFT_696559 [Bisporella sp. PMI_857]
MSLIGSACDTCKRRKVKCDAEKPCSNCRISHLSCEFRIPSRRRGRKPNKTLKLPTNRDNRVVVASLQTPQHCVEQPHTSLSSPKSITHGVTTVSSQPSKSAIFQDVTRIHTDLVCVVNGLLAPRKVADLIHDCIDLFMQYLFPNTPIAHEPTLRAAASLFSHDGYAALYSHADVSDRQLQLRYLRPFTLITALCAFVISVMPESLVRLQDQLSAPFLQSSLAMLGLYKSSDLENPDSSSLNIRMWHSAASQNMTGKPGAANHYHGEAILLALRLRLHDETALHRDSVAESKLLRLSFWLLYCADKTATVLETRPPILNNFLLNSDFTVLEYGSQEASLLDESQKHYDASFERRLLIGFHLKRRVWSLTSDLILGIKSYANRKNSLANKDVESLKLAELAEAYMVFAGIVDEVPPWLRYIHADSELTDDDTAKYHRACFWTQRSNIMTVFHCSKLVILQKCIHDNIPSVMGLGESQLSWAIRKLEIAQDFLYELKIVPFICFKVQGETAVERIRRVGSILLQLVHNSINETITAQAHSIFTQLLEMLAKLDSRACDELDKEKT